MKYVNGQNTLELSRSLSKITIDTEKGDAWITEKQFRNALKDFDTKNTLKKLSDLAHGMYTNSLDVNEWEQLAKSLFRHKKTGILIHQSAIEYLSNMLIVSDSGKTKDFISYKDNLLGLFNIYNNSLIINPLKGDNLLSFMIRTWQEQFRTQSNDTELCGRTLSFFEDNNDIKVISDKTLDEIFIQENGMTINQYLFVGLLIYALFLHDPSIPMDSIKQVKKGNLMIKPNLIDSFLGIHSASEAEIRNIDKEKNKNLDPKNTKNRFNPLWAKPILKNDQGYTVPSISAYAQSLFTGLYWWFDSLFMKQSFGPSISKTAFRECFGKEIFEKYVGDVLKDIYGEDNVIPEIEYGQKQKKEFTDYVVVNVDDAYLFEVKAYQLPFNILQSGEVELLAKDITKKLIKSTIEKINKKIEDISNDSKLHFLKGKNLIPVVVVYNLPLIDTRIYRQNIQTIVGESLSKTFKSFSGYFINIADLEKFVYLAGVSLKDVLQSVKDNDSNFQNEVHKLYDTHGRDIDSLSRRRFDKKMDEIQHVFS